MGEYRTRIEIEGNGIDDSWEGLELGCRNVQERENHVFICHISLFPAE
jgi:hypothetical protein